MAQAFVRPFDSTRESELGDFRARIHSRVFCMLENVIVDLKASNIQDNSPMIPWSFMESIQMDGSPIPTFS